MESTDNKNEDENDIKIEKDKYRILNKDEEDEILLTPKKGRLERKHKSLVWDYFEKLNGTRVRCRLCGLEQSYQGNTWNILRHLKSIHKIDATKRGQSLNASTNNIEQQSQQQQRSQQQVKKLKQQPSTDDEDQMRSNSSCDEFKVEPFQDTEPLVNFATADMNILYREPDEDCFDSRRHPSKRKNSLEDDRIIAETEYFREKAAYFRIQKHLAALQAKKVKFELDQLYMSHSVKHN